MRKTIDKLQADPSKAEEIQFLETIAESIPDDAYLKGLFTNRFVNFIAQKIRDDWYCDFMDMYQAEIDNASKAEAKLKALQKQDEEIVKGYMKTIDAADKYTEMLEGDLKVAKEKVKQEYDRYWKLRQQLDKVNGKAMRDVALLEKENEDLKDEVVNLKAKMFDMQEKIETLEKIADYDSIQAD
jgi:hypothetical protein